MQEGGASRPLVKAGPKSRTESKVTYQSCDELSTEATLSSRSLPTVVTLAIVYDYRPRSVVRRPTRQRESPVASITQHRADAVRCDDGLAR
jgi:hypothetical protein